MTDLTTNKYLRTLMTDNAYIGGYKKDGKWFWADGTTFSYSNWYPGKPGPASSPEDKLEIFHGWGDSYWNDVSNNHPYNHGYLCQYSVKSKFFTFIF